MKHQPPEQLKRVRVSPPEKPKSIRPAPPEKPARFKASPRPRPDKKVSPASEDQFQVYEDDIQQTEIAEHQDIKKTKETMATGYGTDAKLLLGEDVGEKQKPQPGSQQLIYPTGGAGRSYPAPPIPQPETETSRPAPARRHAAASHSVLLDAAPVFMIPGKPIPGAEVSGSIPYAGMAPGRRPSMPRGKVPHARGRRGR